MRVHPRLGTASNRGTLARSNYVGGLQRVLLDGANVDKCVRIISGAHPPRRLREPEAGCRIDVRFGLKVDAGKREPDRQSTGRQAGREFDLARRDSAEVNPRPVNAAYARARIV